MMRCFRVGFVSADAGCSLFSRSDLATYTVGSVFPQILRQVLCDHVDDEGSKPIYF